MEQSLRKTFWSDAAKAGGIVGIILFLLALIDSLVQSKGLAGILSLLNFVVLAVFIYRFARARAAKYGVEGFSYGQSMGYILAMMLFTGVIYGFGTFILSNYIAKEYFDAAFEASLENNPFYDPDSPVMEQALSQLQSLTRNPLFLILSGVISMVFYGGLIGLIASAFTKKKPDIFADNTQTPDEM